MDELEEPYHDTHYDLKAADDKILKKLDLVIFQLKVFIALVALDVIVKMYFA
ncbi:hypothetical protein KFK09_002645 [Dendrobium nobile]|uniref:Uncharacterized protein n=1 Tax=Dendrobium nobile TaxID=94219 RepID=A0A8T3C4E8_DENNO|nr:hypothetical protein KFK09_002645 [Dendrobium nobile]